MYQDTLQQLFHLWKVACQERDEARDELQRSVAELSELKKLLSSILLPETELQADNPYTYFSDSHSQFSYSSPLDCVSLTASSPGMSDLGTYGSIQTSNVQVGTDYASLVIDNLAKGKALPEKGKLLQAVMEAGPLLEPLLITGPIPKWRNPPTLPVSQVECDGGMVNPRKPFGSNLGQNSASCSAKGHRLCGSGMKPAMHYSIAGRRTRFQ